MRPLTQMEHDILGHLAKGLKREAIAECLRIPPSVVKYQLAVIYRTLGFTGGCKRVQAANWYLRSQAEK